MSDNRGIGTRREGKEPIEGHASSSSETAIATGTRRPDISNVEPEEEFESGRQRLLIPVEAALEYFPPLANCPETYMGKIEICNPQNSVWQMTLTYDPSDCSLVVENKWKRFVAWNRLEILDMIRFYKSVLISYDFHYLVEIVKRRSPMIIHLFKPENFMFQLPLTDRDIQYKRLFITAEDTCTSFTLVSLPIEFEKGGGNLTQSETEATDDTMDRGGDGQGDGGGRSHSGGRKWWKFGFGGCCMAMKSNARTEES
ncbi:hypothetical protein C3L33_21730, partial [Rhododendron williamsianum]